MSPLIRIVHQSVCIPLPNKLPDRRSTVAHDGAFSHSSEGEVGGRTPLAEPLGGQNKHTQQSIIRIVGKRVSVEGGGSEPAQHKHEKSSYLL